MNDYLNSMMCEYSEEELGKTFDEEAMLETMGIDDDYWDGYNGD